MTDKVYSIYLRIAKLACNNIKYQIGRYNRISERTALADIKVKVRNKDALVMLSERISCVSQSRAMHYVNDVESLLVVQSEYAFSGSIGAVFIDSVIKSRQARLAQKEYMELQMCEIYLQEAHAYDKIHPYTKKEESALETAKNVVLRKYGSDVINQMVLVNKPQIRTGVKESLIAVAFNKYYAFADVTPVTNLKLAQKKYASEFGSRDDFFMSSKRSGPGYAQYNAIRQASNMLKDPLPAIDDHVVRQPDTSIIPELYQGEFANISLKHRIRKFVNLKVKNRDILICPPKNLAVKRQYATIEAMTKHHYIMEYYNDNKPKNIKSDELPYYFYDRELELYKKMWGTKAEPYITNGIMQFPNGQRISVPASSEPYEFFHKVNCTYGALFGFTSDDIEGGKDWLNDSIRSAYTDEGMAEYRLAMIDARLKGKV